MDTRPVADVLTVFNQWRAGTILDAEERQALRVQPASRVSTSGTEGTFADVLRQAGDGVSQGGR
ncbi:MAG TPA: hypothetical protein VMV93_10310 [Chloroflexota bacterium]|nr:hypothetical protein [Chloroflexota bacterium]